MRAPTASVRALAPLAAALLLWGAPSAAWAEYRLWESGQEEEEGPHRYFDVTAYLQPGYIFRLTQGDPHAAIGEDGFWLQRARFGFEAQILDWLRMRMQLDFAPALDDPGGLDDEGSDILQDAYVDMPFFDAFRVRVGQFRVPFLLAYQFDELNLGFIDRPVYTPLEPDRPFLPFLFARDVGLMFHGLVGDIDPLNRMPVLEYQLGTFLGGGATTARNVDDALLYAGRLRLHVRGLPVGVEWQNDLVRNSIPRVAVGGGVYTNCDRGRHWNRGVTADTELRWEGLYASAAFLWLRNGPVRGSGFGELLGYDDFCNPAPGESAALDFVSRGAHLQLQYALPELLFPVPTMGLEVLGRVDWVDPRSPHDPDGALFGGGPADPGYVRPSSISEPDNAPTRWRLTVGINWFPTNRQTIRVQVNYQHNREVEDIQTLTGTVGSVDNDVLWLQLTAGI